MHALSNGGRVPARFCHSGQHPELGRSVLTAANIVPDETLMRPDAGDIGGLLAGLTASIGGAIDRQRPHAVVVQGDTATTLAGAMAAFHRQIPVAHVEAGLRSGDLARPWPEEGYRRLVSRLTRWHFAPTPAAAKALRDEGTAHDSVEHVGNTVIDALHWALSLLDEDESFGREALPLIKRAGRRPIVLATVHRRELDEAGLKSIAQGLRALVACEGVELILPLHPREESIILRDILGQVPHVTIVPPLDYFAFLRLMRAARLIVSDSGGIQEEATALGKPLLILRDVTERPEALDSGAGQLVGADPGRLLAEAQEALSRPEPAPSDAFGDGNASRRIAERLARDL